MRGRCRGARDLLLARRQQRVTIVEGAHQRFSGFLADIAYPQSKERPRERLRLAGLDSGEQIGRALLLKSWQPQQIIQRQTVEVGRVGH